MADIYKYTELQVLVPWEIRELVHIAQPDKELYISEYTLLGRDFFAAICLEVFPLNVLPVMGPKIQPTPQAIKKSEKIE